MPPIHPILVHFPIALLTLAAILEAAALLLRREELSRAGWWAQLVGTLAAGFAVVTGIAAGDIPHISVGAAEALDTHQELAFLASGAFAALLLWRIAARTLIPGPRRWIYVGLLGLGAVLILVVGWFGGELFFHYGVGVGAR